MKEITQNEIIHCITQALENGTRNILFISPGLQHYELIPRWAETHPQYRLIRSTPQPLYEEKNGILVKNPKRFCIADEILERANNEHSIWFFLNFSEQGLYDFDGVLKIIKSRTYTNSFDDDTTQTHTLEKMPLVIAYSTPPGVGYFPPLESQYYNLFEAIYLVK